MRLLHIKGRFGERYIVIDKIEKFEIIKEEEIYHIDVFTGGQPFPIAVNISKPQKIIQDLLNAINTIDNDIIEYTIKEKE